jgi:YggT family protein
MVVSFIVQTLDKLLALYSLVIVVRAFVSLLGADLRNPVTRFIFDITEPVLAPLRRFTIIGMWDFSPVAAIILLMVLRFALSLLH